MRRKHDSYDYIIIGGGSAGSVLGARLSEDKDKNVLVLEAGRSDYFWDLFIQMPAALMFLQVTHSMIGDIKLKKNHIWDVKSIMPEGKYLVVQVQSTE